MLARVHSCAVIGLEGVVVEVEVDTCDGLPGMDIVGLPDKAVQESKNRVQAAIKNAGLFFPRKRLVVNLAPASVRKEGPAYDLPIALGVLICAQQLDPELVDGSLVVGELSLDGGVRHSRGVLPMAVKTDFREIKGQEHVKRALKVAAAGSHKSPPFWGQVSRFIY